MLTRRHARLAAISLAVVLPLAIAQGASAHRLSGTVATGDGGVAGSRVTLFAGKGDVAARLGSTTTDRRGDFRLRYPTPGAGSVLYAVASGGDLPAGGALKLLAVADPANRTPRRLALNELTTVASAYSLSRFLRGSRLRGPSPGLANAAATVPSLVVPASGRVGAAMANPPNGAETATLATYETLAAILGGCTTGTRRSCAKLFAAARPAGERRARNTLAAIHDIALNPVNHVRRIYALAKSDAYGPILDQAPSSWVLSLLHTDGGYNGPGRMAFDSRGNIWVTNNFEGPPPGLEPGLGVISLDPTGSPRNDSPVTGGGVMGNWWGIAVDRSDRVWLGNFTGDDPNEFYSPDFVGGHIASLFTRNGRAVVPDGITAGDLQGPQGIAVDVRDNVWIANHSSGTVTMYPNGSFRRAEVISGSGLYNPFTIVTDDRGGVWVDNGSLDASVPGTLTRISPAGRASGPFEVDGMRSPQGMAIDSRGDLWVASLVDSTVTWLGKRGNVKGQFRVPSIEGAWGVAVDGDDNIWVASFIGQKVSQLCGRRTETCPKGMETGDPISPRLPGFTNGGLEHITAVQVDQSGNVWAANNWANIDPTVGGNGLVEYIGAAAPVDTPLIGLPQPPASGR